MQKINRLKEVLKEQQLSQVKLSEMLMVTDVTVSNWCTNKAQPSLEKLYEIAKVLNIKAKDILAD